MYQVHEDCVASGEPKSAPLILHFSRDSIWFPPQDPASPVVVSILDDLHTTRQILLRQQCLSASLRWLWSRAYRSTLVIRLLAHSLPINTRQSSAIYPAGGETVVSEC